MQVSVAGVLAGVSSGVLAGVSSQVSSGVLTGVFSGGDRSGLSCAFSLWPWDLNPGLTLARLPLEPLASRSLTTAVQSVITGLPEPVPWEGPGAEQGCFLLPGVPNLCQTAGSRNQGFPSHTQ
jgi:hypothetical protein